jgi:hypothetical protein
MDRLLQNSIELAREQSPGEKLAQALELMDWGIRLQRTRLRADHPRASEEDIERMLTAWLCRE